MEGRDAEQYLLGVFFKAHLKSNTGFVHPALGYRSRNKKNTVNQQALELLGRGRLLLIVNAPTLS